MRRKERFMALVIILTSVIGLAYETGLIKGKFSGDIFSMAMPLAVVYNLVYYLIEFNWLKRHRKGVFLAFWKFSAFITITASCIIGWIFMSPYYHSLSAMMQKGMMFTHVALPIELFIEWIIGEKGHYQKQFFIMGIFPLCAYVLTALIMASLNMKMGMQGDKVPYPFLDIDLLGFRIVLMTCILYAVMLVIYTAVIIDIDQSLVRKR